ncbi:9215_t:CDS:2 [Acaulospora morrowiae]|uniref:9215_t:CDS:1 n=1 Tax=Acaulospora morrowiae TaxID=94023 RepID=A0A9N8WI00_9GLOM|nr:9215_t:CDS:2 [Acaulospora morrowiae]
MTTTQLSKRCPSCQRKYIEEKGPWCKQCDLPKGWTSGNDEIDDFIKTTQNKLGDFYEDCFLEWIPFDRLRNLYKIGKGGYGTVYCADWIDGKRCWDPSTVPQTRTRQPCKVALKSLNDGENYRLFLEEVRSHYDAHNSSIYENPFPMYGISRDPSTQEYLIVMPFVENGNLRTYIKNNFRLLDWKFKLYMLYTIAIRLDRIHNMEMIHRDLHGGNILVIIGEDGFGRGEITDFGLCLPERNVGNGEVYGVLPYVAPEVLIGKVYSQAADVYAFGIIMCEMTTGEPAFCDRAHDADLAREILDGLRPKILEGTPLEYVKLAKRCLDIDPEKRPLIWEIRNFFTNRRTAPPQEYREADKLIKNSSPRPTRYPDEIYTSRRLDLTTLNQSDMLSIQGESTSGKKPIFFSDSGQINLEIPDLLDS